MFLRTAQFEKIRRVATETINDIFRVSLISYLFFYLIESIKAGFVSDYFQLNTLLITAIGSGAITVLIKENQHDRESQYQVSGLHIRQYLFLLAVGIVSALFIYYKTKQLGQFAYIISAISGLIIIVLSILLWRDGADIQENDQHDKRSLH